LSRFEVNDAAERIGELPLLPLDEEGPVKLSEQGHFTWKEWAGALADELKAAEARGEPDDGSQYYHHWVAALEGLVTAKGLTDSSALLTRKEAWADAYRHTPHGKPVVLSQSE
jgi:nitrile hydratase accessory protein